ncbi:MAG: N-acetylmuramoyl-L-alanine amidase [Ferruginibacter sp.]
MKYSLSYIAILFQAVLFFNSCAPKPYAATNKIYKEKANAFAHTMSRAPTDNALDSLREDTKWIGTTNFGMRKPNFVIIHHTAQNSCEKTLQTFTKDSTEVSAHYVICKDGTLHHMLNDYLRAWHAGAGKWGNTTDINSASIGIELDNNGVDSFSEVQLYVLENLLAILKSKYNIPAANFLGHADIAPGRKVDPSIHFPWKRFANSGYGLWFDDTTNVIVPDNFSTIMALRIIGYDVSKPAAAIQAFRQHFLGPVLTGELMEPEKKVLYVLMQKYM